jgi:dihydrofolate reductase
MIGSEGGDTGVDNEFFAAGETGIGATIMGRNMFGPIRGSWGEDDWRGWWGDNPPFHHPVFVLTHHPHEPIEMAGGTTFNFVSDDIEAVLSLAVKAADGADVRLGGGVATIQQFLQAGLIDDLHLAIVPILLGRGERLFGDVDPATAGYECVEHRCSPAVTHVRVARGPAIAEP